MIAGKAPDVISGTSLIYWQCSVNRDITIPALAVSASLNTYFEYLWIIPYPILNNCCAFLDIYYLRSWLLFIMLSSLLLNYKICNQFGNIVENLHSTDDGESGEKSHGASKRWQHVYKLNCFILSDSVKCWCVKIDPHEL